jgi:hypothetical protein
MGAARKLLATGTDPMAQRATDKITKRHAAKQFVPDQGRELLYDVHGVRLSDAVCKALLEQGFPAWG